MIEQRLGELAQEASVPGAVLGVWDGSEATITPYGVVSTRTGQPTSADSVFQIGSITKTWTATMVAQLVEEGWLSYDAPVADLLPGVRTGRDDASDRITIRHLLTHSSGLDGDVFDDTGRGDDAVERYVELLADVERTFEPGAAYSYCNSGFVLLGRIIEVLDGRTWEESLRERLVRPLGLTNTVTLPEEAILRSAAIGHHGPPDVVPHSTWTLPRAIGPAGLITCSAADLLAYARLHLDRGAGLLSETAVLQMWEQQLPIPEQLGGIGLSWRVASWNGERVLAHDGGTVGQIAKLRLLPDRGFALCLLTNSDNGEALAERLLPEVLAELAGVTAPDLPVPDPAIEVSGLERHVGRYSRRGVDFDVEQDAERGDAEQGAGLRVTIRPHFGIGGLDEVETVTMLPTDASGDRFAGRPAPTEAWWRIAFATLPDGRPQLFSSGRVAPRV
ncbi:beta-lactamase family protein [Nocardioides agariphilus]|uniref:Beta-lactamase family protein n=1 Tax=Nocardioides agariphilus TaxID=433664 RepID=A0A930YID0_9ACTN|nr:beta-lactamase family protein [Nocardioides agariphilus]